MTDMREALKQIVQKRNELRENGTVTPENAFEAFGRLNKTLCEFGDIARAALAAPGEPVAVAELDDRALILAAMEYRDGNDSCNSFYMGSMATAKLYHALDLKYGGTVSFKETLMAASDDDVRRVKAIAQPYIDYMLKHPVHRCPSCHQITKERVASPSALDVEEVARIMCELRSRISDRLNNVLCEMKPDCDDSIVGFNEAWDVVRKAFDEIPPAALAKKIDGHWMIFCSEDDAFTLLSSGHSHWQPLPAPPALSNKG